MMVVGGYSGTMVHTYQNTKVHIPEDISFQHTDKVSRLTNRRNEFVSRLGQISLCAFAARQKLGSTQDSIL
jgi:hypothetical protein